MKYFSLFSGIGGFELGINNSWKYRQRTQKLQCISSVRDRPNIESGDESFDPYPKNIGFSEIDKYAIQIYKKHFPSHKEYSDVQQIKWNDVEDFELLVGGFPCQAFSIAGRRRGFDDTRGTLFFEIARAAQEKQPRLLLLENVKGLLSHDKGKTFGIILNTLDELGYDLQWQVLNSKNFGVPQNRERVFLVGHLRGTSRPQIFPITRTYSENVQQSSKEQNRRSWVSTLDSRYGQRWSTETYVRTNKQNTQPQRNKPDNSNSIRRATYSDDMRIRRLTPTECERLQGFPDGWTEGISDNQRYKCLGNAVTVNVVQAIAERLL